MRAGLTEFPTADDVLAEYALDWHYISFGSPEQLEEVDHAIARSSQAKWEAKLATAHDEVVLQLREAAMFVMRDLAVRLSPGDDGKPKALRATALLDLQELLGKLPVLNITEDDQLATIMARVGAMAEGLDVETLRKAPAMRGMLLQAAEQAVSKLDDLVTSGRRAMDLG